jgi:acyl-coenzyme A thioesterase 9
MPMRVKTPWIEALTQSHKADGTAQDGTPRAQPDLTPKRISDSSYTAVCIGLS